MGSLVAEHRLEGTLTSVVGALGSRVQALVVVVHRLSCFAACGIFLDQESNPCPLCWQANS